MNGFKRILGVPVVDIAFVPMEIIVQKFEDDEYGSEDDVNISRLSSEETKQAQTAKQTSVANSNQESQNSSVVSQAEAKTPTRNAP